MTRTNARVTAQQLAEVNRDDQYDAGEGVIEEKTTKKDDDGLTFANI